MLTKQEKEQLLSKSQALGINITMYMKITNALDLNISSYDFNDYLKDISSPVYYDTTEETYEDSDNHYWIFDPQVLTPQNTFTDVTFKANTESEFWKKLQEAITYKQKEEHINK